ncbi:MAG TPA: cation:proton antiporter [Dehalococcoidia bacterium]|nr:cation:proton antiporter [Dehalococcoidia bacterium]
MEGETRLLLDVSVALAVALVGGWIATRLRLSSIVGYVAAGMLISPFTPGFVGDLDSLLVIADIGIVLLLFAVGVQFDIRDILRGGPRLAVVASLQVVGVLAAVSLAGPVFGWTAEEALYIGAAASVTSSAVIAKLLDERGDMASEHGRVALSWSIVQDLWAVVLIVALAALAEGEGALDSMSSVALAGLKAGAFILAVVIVGIRVIPFVLARVAEERSRELFFLAITALAIGTALASDYVGLSLALGAFLAGIVVSESDLSHRVLGELLPTRDVFAVIFFTSAGMLIDPDVIADWWLVLAVLACILLAKGGITFVLANMLTPVRQTALLMSVALVPAGEFSFLLARSGLEEGVLSEDMFAVILAATVLSIVVSPAALAAGYRWVQREPAPPEPEHPDHPVPRLGRRAIVVGFNATGELVAGTLAGRFDVTVVESDPVLARAGRDRGFHVVEGNPTSYTIIDQMNLPDARVLIITLADPFATRLLVERARERNHHLDIITRASGPQDAERLLRSGATATVAAESEVAYEMVRYGLRRFGISQQEALAIVQRLRERR